ncbi:MAG: hypothetical protein ABL933_10170 [Methyloglobulus sp.]
MSDGITYPVSRNMFYITDLQLQPLTDPSKQEQLREELIAALDENLPDRATSTM